MLLISINISLQEKLYLFMGKVIALLIVNGGPGPTFLAPVVDDYLFGGIACVKPSVEDVPDETVRSKIQKVCCTCVINYNALPSRYVSCRISEMFLSR